MGNITYVEPRVILTDKEFFYVVVISVIGLIMCAFITDWNRKPIKRMNAYVRAKLGMNPPPFIQRRDRNKFGHL